MATLISVTTYDCGNPRIDTKFHGNPKFGCQNMCVATLEYFKKFVATLFSVTKYDCDSPRIARNYGNPNLSAETHGNPR